MGDFGHNETIESPDANSNYGGKRESINVILIFGTIVRGRSMGRNLAFAKIQLSQSENDFQKNEASRSSPEANGLDSELKCESLPEVEALRSLQIVDVKFLHSRFIQHNCENHLDTHSPTPKSNTLKESPCIYAPFPVKKSDLAPGTMVEMLVDLKEARNPASDEKNGFVLLWRKLSDPLKNAKEAAHVRERGTGSKYENGSGLVCSRYFRYRANLFYNLNGRPFNDVSTINAKKPSSASITMSCPRLQNMKCHDGARKALRAKIFAKWILENLLKDKCHNKNEEEAKDSQRTHVIDIAGGRGLLSMELASAGIPCTVIDPLIRKKPNTKALKKHGAPIPNFIHEAFTAEFQHDRRLSCSESVCFVGLHPDECTEDIIDVALRLNVSVAVVPCCVFPSFFPLRRLATGAGVSTYEEFCQYLLEKDKRLRRSSLNFEGRNELIYMVL